MACLGDLVAQDSVGDMHALIGLDFCLMSPPAGPALAGRGAVSKRVAEGENKVEVKETWWPSRPCVRIRRQNR